MNDWFLKENKKQNEHNTNAVTTRVNESERARMSVRAINSRVWQYVRERARAHLIAVLIIGNKQNSLKHKQTNKQTLTHTDDSTLGPPRARERKQPVWACDESYSLFLSEPRIVAIQPSRHRWEWKPPKKRAMEERNSLSLAKKKKNETIISCNKIIHYLNFDNFF